MTVVTHKPRFKRSALIEKIDEQSDGTLHVSGFASTEERDSDGEMILASAMAEALAGYMKWGAVREMHQPKAAGVALESSVDLETKKTAIRVHVVDPVACEKVRKGVYKAFSISGPVLERDVVDPSVIKRLKWIETSLVDRPANEGATIDEILIVKAEGIDSVEKSMWSVARAAELIGSLTSLCAQAEWDAPEMAWAATMKADVVALCDTFKSMVDEETAALAGNGAEEMVAAMAKVAGLETTVDDLRAELVAARIAAAVAVEQVAALKSAAPVQDGGADQVAKLEGDKATRAGQLSAATDSVAKMKGERDDALAKVVKLEEQIAKSTADLEIAVNDLFAKGVLRSVPKERDTGKLPTDEETVDDTDPSAVRKMIKKAHASGGKALVATGSKR